MLLKDYIYNPDNKVFYYISNDDNNIYLNLRVADKSSQIKILRFGLTVWVDSKAKTGINLGIKFPIENNDMPPTFGRKVALENKKLELSQQSAELELIGFKGKGSHQIISASDTNNIHGKLELAKDSSLNYKLIIPVKSITSVTQFKEGNLLSIGLQSGYLDVSNFQKPGQGPGMERGGDRGGLGGNWGGRHGGGMGGFGPPDGGTGRPQGGYGGNRPRNFNPEKMQQRMAERESLSKPIKFWIERIQLANKNQ